MEGKYADIVVNCNKVLLTRYCLIVTQKSTLFFFGTSEKQMVNVNASCLPETAGLRLNLLSFFFFMLISFLLDIDIGTFLK